MANKITEPSLEQFTTDLLDVSSRQYVNSPDISPDRDFQVLRAQDAQERREESATVRKFRIVQYVGISDILNKF